MPVKINPIPYTQDELKEIFEYREGRLFWKKKVNKNTILNTSAGGTQGNRKYITCTLKGTPYLLHRLIWKYFTGNNPKGYIDHIDCNPGNNIFKNLRDISPRKNSQNTLRAKNGKLIGTSLNRHGSYSSRIVLITDGNKIWKALGNYKTELEAHEAYINYLKDHPEIL